MVATRLGALALAILISPAGASAQDITWGCAFDKFSGRTFCYEGAGQPQRRTGRIIVSKPNVGIPGRAVSDYGEKVEVYLGGNGTGHQKFRWQE